MGVINSPLGALGALMILLEALAVGAIATLDNQPGLQELLVWTIIANISFITVCVVVLIAYVAFTDIALLFDPRSFPESVQQRIYVGGRRDRTLIAPPQELVSIVTAEFTEHESTDSEPEDQE